MYHQLKVNCIPPVLRKAIVLDMRHMTDLSISLGLAPHKWHSKCLSEERRWMSDICCIKTFQISVRHNVECRSTNIIVFRTGPTNSQGGKYNSISVGGLDTDLFNNDSLEHVRQWHLERWLISIYEMHQQMNWKGVWPFNNTHLFYLFGFVSVLNVDYVYRGEDFTYTQYWLRNFSICHFPAYNQSFCHFSPSYNTQYSLQRLHFKISTSGRHPC